MNFTPLQERKKYDRLKLLRKIGRERYWIEWHLNHWATEKGETVLTDTLYAVKVENHYWEIPKMKIAVYYDTMDFENIEYLIRAGYNVVTLTPENYKQLVETLDAFL